MTPRLIKSLPRFKPSLQPVFESKKGESEEVSEKSRGNKLPMPCHCMPWPVLLFILRLSRPQKGLNPAVPRPSPHYQVSFSPYDALSLLLPAKLRRGTQCNVMLASLKPFASLVGPAESEVTSRLARVRHVFDGDDPPTGPTFWDPLLVSAPTRTSLDSPWGPSAQ